MAGNFKPAQGRLKMFHRRIIISRYGGPGVVERLYDVKSTNLPIHDIERFGDGILSTTAIHTHEVLAELLAEAIGSWENAQQILSDVTEGDRVEVVMLPQADTKLVDKLKKSSAEVGEKT
jgi:hypothetical protein